MHSASGTDTTAQFAAVGFFSNGCTGTRIAPDLVLTAARCFPDIVRGCDGLGHAVGPLSLRKHDLLRGITFNVNASGSSHGGASLNVDDVVFAPGAYANLGSCSVTSNINCAKADRPPTADPTAGRNLESDEAIVHLTSNSHPVVRVITDISDPSLSSSASWAHVDINPSTDLASTSTAQPIVVGWGNDDQNTTTRRSGFAQFTLDPVGWDEACGGAWTCLGPPSGACSINGTGGGHPITALVVHRVLPDGIVPAAGDWGGPLIVSGGTSGFNGAGGGMADLAPTGEPFILGVMSAGDETPGGQSLPSGQDFPSEYSATFHAANGAWIEKITHDFDGDGIADDADNCPTVPNAGQSDTNFDAELQFVLDLDACGDYSSTGCPAGEGHVPTASDTDAYVSHFHAFYPGDACDTNATTAASTFTATNPFGQQDTCVQCTIIGSTMAGCSPWPGHLCPTRWTSGIHLDSFIGSPLGDAPTTTGTTEPSFCRCDGADSDPTWHADCQSSSMPLPCTIGRDILFPEPAALPGSGWQHLTLGSFGGIVFDVPYVPLQTTHQEKSDSTILSGAFNPVANAGADSIWDFLTDRSEFGVPTSSTSMTGVLWANVQTFEAVSFEGNPVTNLPDSFLPTTVAVEPGVVFRAFNPLYRPVFGIWELGGQPHDTGDPPWTVIVNGIAPIEQTMTGGSSLAGDRYDAVALSLLAGVGSGASDLLVGDDVVAGVAFHATLNAAVIVGHDTTDVLGALSPNVAGRVGGVLARTSVPGVDPVDLRSYDATDGVLRSLHVAGAAAALTAVDVQAALTGVSRSVTTPVTGVIPSGPLAVAWNQGESSLYVLDAPSIRHRTALRLLRIDPKSVSRELWRLEGVRQPPANVFLSMSRDSSERVLSMVVDGRSEIAAFDSNGVATWSTTVSGELAAPAISSDGGVSLALRGLEGRFEKGLLRLRLIPRTHTAKQLCGAPWLREHAASDPRGECDREGRDGDAYGVDD
jgi:hypothetical protein